MRQRVLDTLKARHREGALAGARWRAGSRRVPGHHHQHHRRVLPVAAARVPARSRRRSRLRSGRRDRDAAPGERRARSRARASAGPRARPTPTSRCCSRSSASCRSGADWPRCSTGAWWRAMRSTASCMGSTLHVGRCRAARLHDALRQARCGTCRAASARSCDRAADTPTSCCWRTTCRLLAGATPMPPERLRGALDRLCDHVLTQEDASRGSGWRRRKAEFRSAADFEAPQAAGAGARPAGAGGARRVPPRSQPA